MLSTGIRTPLGLKISGGDLARIEQLGAQVETVLKAVPGTRSVFAERTGSGYFPRHRLGSRGAGPLRPDHRGSPVRGGERHRRRKRHTVIQGQERYPVNVRYLRDFRSDLSAVERVLVSDAGRPDPGSAGPTRQRDRLTTGPAMIRNEDGLLTGYVYVDVGGRDLQGYIDEAGQAAARKGPAAARLRCALERPIRGHAAGEGAPVGSSSRVTLFLILFLHLPEHAIAGENLDRPAGGAVLRGRRRLVPLPARTTT